MKASYHVVLSAGVSLGLQAAVHSWPATIGCFFSGVLIDLDHYLEYYLARGKFPFRYKDLKDFCAYDNGNKVYLVLHAYEILFVLWLSFYYLHLGMVWMGIALGLTVHLIFDQFTNPIKPLFYFMAYRISNHFEKAKILSDDYFQRRRQH